MRCTKLGKDTSPSVQPMKTGTLALRSIKGTTDACCSTAMQAAQEKPSPRPSAFACATSFSDLIAKTEAEGEDLSHQNPLRTFERPPGNVQNSEIPTVR